MDNHGTNSHSESLDARPSIADSKRVLLCRMTRVPVAWLNFAYIRSASWFSAYVCSAERFTPYFLNYFINNIMFNSYY